MSAIAIPENAIKPDSLIESRAPSIKLPTIDMTLSIGLIPVWPSAVEKRAERPVADRPLSLDEMSDSRVELWKLSAAVPVCSTLKVTH
ncbi:hypothetical protein D3C78_891870 [compost metagenome]